MVLLASWADPLTPFTFAESHLVVPRVIELQQGGIMLKRTHTGRPKVRRGPAAIYVGKSKSSMDKLRVYGGGPRYIKLGRTVLYDLDDLDEWMEEHKRTSTSVPL